MNYVLTIGYEAATIDDFIATLKNTKVKQVIDVRALPLSRRRGFSKNALSHHLLENGINYVHIGALGDPQPGRQAARAGQIDKFKKIYLAHLRSQEAQAALETLSGLAVKNKICLLCYERLPDTCHRSLIASALSEFGAFDVRHLFVEPTAQELREGASKRPRRAGANSRQSGATPQSAAW
jgi:uncharacterized protein (DUF488 family)